MSFDQDQVINDDAVAKEDDRPVFSYLEICLLSKKKTTTSEDIGMYTF